jgi:hypothetical protein
VDTLGDVSGRESLTEDRQMTMWQVTSSAGVDMGVYEGETPADALDAMARDAGYKSQADATDSGISPFEGTVAREMPAGWEPGHTVYALEIAALECDPVDGYEVGDVLYAQIHSEDESLGCVTYELTADDLGVDDAEEDAEES